MIWMICKWVPGGCPEASYEMALSSYLGTLLFSSCSVERICDTAAFICRWAINCAFVTHNGGGRSETPQIAFSAKARVHAWETTRSRHLFVLHFIQNTRDILLYKRPQFSFKTPDGAISPITFQCKNNISARPDSNPSYPAEGAISSSFGFYKEQLFFSSLYVFKI